MRRLLDIVFATFSRHWKLVSVFAMFATLAVAMLQSMNHSVWFDEGYSIMLAQRPIAELISLTAVDAHPPFYYLLLKLWGSIFGWSELSLRFSSAIMGALSVGIMIAIVRRLFSPKVAVAVVPFLVFAPFLARYNYEIRMYALVGLIGVAATWVLLKAHESRSAKWWGLYAVLVALGMYTLYMSVVIWLAHAAWLVYQSRVHKTPIVRQEHWLYFGAAILLFAPWIPTVVYQLFNSALPPYMTAITMTELINVASMLLGYNAEWQIGPWLSLWMFAIFTLAIYLFAHVWRRASPKYRQGLMLVLLGFVAALIFYTIISLPPNPPRFMERYMLHVALFFYAMIGIVVALGWRMGRHKAALTLGVASFALLMYGQFTLYQVGNYNFQRLQVAQAKTIRQQVGCDQTTFVTSGPFGYIDMWYDFQGCELKFYYPWDVNFTGGFAPVNGSANKIKNTDSITSKRIVFVYFDDSEVFLTPDSRYKQVGQQSFSSTHIQIYEQ